MHKAKKLFCNKKIEDCAQAKNPKQSWKLINVLLGKISKPNHFSQLRTDEATIPEDYKDSRVPQRLLCGYWDKISA